MKVTVAQSSAAHTSTSAAHTLLRVLVCVCIFVSDRNILIDKDNKILLRRMEEISLTPQTDCHLHRRAAQTNYGHRVLYVNQLNEDNLVKEAPQHTAHSTHTLCDHQANEHLANIYAPPAYSSECSSAFSAHTLCTLTSSGRRNVRQCCTASPT